MTEPNKFRTETEGEEIAPGVYRTRIKAEDTLGGSVRVGPTKAEKKRGFKGLPCPKCGALDTCDVSLKDTDLIYCHACGEDFGPNYVRFLVDQWQPVLAWLGACPELEKEQGPCPNH